MLVLLSHYIEQRILSLRKGTVSVELGRSKIERRTRHLVAVTSVSTFLLCAKRYIWYYSGLYKGLICIEQSALELIQVTLLDL